MVDLAIGAGSLLIAWWLVSVGALPVTKEVPALSAYLHAMPISLAVLLFSAHLLRLYRPRRAGSFGSLLLDVLKVHLQAALILLALGFYYRGFSYSRVIVTSFIGLNAGFMFLHHFLRMARERHQYVRGIGTRSCLIVGVGDLARRVAERIEAHPRTGLSIAGFIDPRRQGSGADLCSVPAERVLGNCDDVESVLGARQTEEVLLSPAQHTRGGGGRTM